MAKETLADLIRLCQYVVGGNRPARANTMIPSALREDSAALITRHITWRGQVVTGNKHGDLSDFGNTSS
jgi:hypothetical protein